MASPPALTLRAGLDQVNESDLREQAQALGVHPLIARLLFARKVVDLEAQRQVLHPKLRDLRPPTAMAGFTSALELLVAGRAKGWRIGVFGDYDVDGVTTAATLTSYLEGVGCEVVAKVARRDAGYGFTVGAARAFQEAGADLVVAGDCGTSDHETLAWLGQRGIKSIVIDHHQVPESPPPADAFINPHQRDCRFPFKGLCSAGVAFYLCAALRTSISRTTTGPVPDPRQLLDLVALGTVCDMVPLVDENRVLVRNGLRVLYGRERPGLRALLERAGVSPTAAIDEEHVGFQLGPRLNAPGRLGAADPSLALLRAVGDPEARSHAEHIESLNQQRKQLAQRAVEEALGLLSADPHLERRAALTVSSSAWVPGIVGIVANAVVEHYRKPVLVLAVDAQTGEARGSVRSHGGVDVRQALASCASLLVRFGGHPQAAGVTVMANDVPALTEAFNAAVAAMECVDDAGVSYDGELGLVDVDTAALRAIADLGPYGVGFESPLFLAQDVVVERCRVLKERHLSMDLRQGDTVHQAIGFRMAHAVPEPGRRVSVLFLPMWNEFGGRRRIQLRLEHIWW